MGWSNLDNGDLLKEADKSFDLRITTDQNLKYQQNLSGPTPGHPGFDNHQLAEDSVENIRRRRRHRSCSAWRLSRIDVLKSVRMT
jgi:hypothetical protein